MKTRLRWVAVALALFLFFFTLFLFAFRDFVREGVVVPILYGFWLSGLIVNSVPQSYYVFGLFILGLILAVASLRYFLAGFQLPAERLPVVEEPSRYQFWLRRCRRIASSGFFLSNLGMELRRLVLMVLAYQEHRDMWELEREIVEKQFDVPPDVHALIAQRQLAEVPATEPGVWNMLLVRFFKAFRLPTSS